MPIACTYFELASNFDFHVMSTHSRTDNETYSDEEIARRRDELAKHMLNTPPRPLKPNKAKAEPKASPKKRGRPTSDKPPLVMRIYPREG